nr:hypothetical protein [Comamonas jiangduensis]
MISHSASNRLMPWNAWHAAWQTAVPALLQHPQALRQTPMSPMVPDLAATSVQQAMEYFAASAKTAV